MVEGEVTLVVQRPSVVERGAIVKLVEGDNVVRIGVGQGKMSYEPACTVAVSNCSPAAGVSNSSHEASTSSDHNILDIWQRLKLGATSQDWGLLPDTKILKELEGIRIRCRISY